MENKFKQRLILLIGKNVILWLHFPHQLKTMSDQPVNCDKNLFLRVSLGEEQAFKQLFNTYHQQLGAYILRLTHSTELAEEIVPDVFLKIWMNREALREVQNFKAYLFVASKNHTLNALKKVAKERLQQKELEEHYTNDVLAEDLNLSQYYSLLDEAIDHLPPQQQKVYLLSRHKRLKYAEIAKKLDLSHETVKKYLQISTISITAYINANIAAGLILLVLTIFF